MGRGAPRPTGEAFDSLPVAVDAMGGDKAPGEIVIGARTIADAGQIRVLLVGLEGQMGDTGDLPLHFCTEVIGMDDDPGQGVRRKKDSSLVRAAEAVRDGEAMAMVSAGNTGATMASALLRMGRLPGVIRPAIATPIPDLKKAYPTVMLDAGANAEATMPMLLQFAQMGAAYSTKRYGVARPRVALLSIGEEKSKGTPLVKETHGLLLEAARGGSGGFEFVGNLEGRDLLPSPADVIVTDGFTGNVALKALEGSLRFLFDTMLGVFGTNEATTEAAGVLLPFLLPIAAEFEPENTGGAMLLGTNGVCVISHGSSNATAMMNAVLVAHECATRGLADHVEAAVRNVELA